jgi:lipopolysaccharide heptosyltransferase I
MRRRSRLKILILKPSSLGDVVHAIPVLRLLKAHLPESEIYWWLDTRLAPLLEDDPHLAGIFPFDRVRWAAPVHWPHMVQTVRSMRREQFDWALDLQGLARSGAFTWLANARLSVGLDGSREGARMYYNLITPPSPPATHAVDRYLAVLPLLGVPVHRNFEWLPQRPHVAAVIREKWAADGKNWVILLPGARWENKRWPVGHFIDTAKHLAASSPETKFAILGGESDRALGNSIAAALPDRCLDLTGRTSLVEMVEWIRLSRFVITNDTGPMHVAAALKKPVVALFGPTAPARTGPYGQLDRVLQLSEPGCIPCLKSHCTYPKPLACLEGISADMVLERAHGLLKA